VGKASLDKAIAVTTHLYDINVKWSPFFLRPTMPKEGAKCGELQPSGNIAPAGPYWHYAIDRARSLGIDMTGGVGGNTFPNTTLAHVLLEWAFKQNPSQQHHLAEKIFEAFYAKEIFLDLDALVALASQTGYDGEVARKWLLSQKGEAAVKASARKSGVSGVPFFIINGEGVFSGAQDPTTFEQAFAQAVRERPLPARLPAVLYPATIHCMGAKELKQTLLTRGADPMDVREMIEKDELVQALMEQQRSSLASLPAKRLKALLAQQTRESQQQQGKAPFAGVEKKDLIQALLQGEEETEETGEPPLGYCTPDGRCY